MTKKNAVDVDAEPYTIVDKVLGASLQSPYGRFEAGAYRLEGPDGMTEHLLLYRNLQASVCNLRINSACFTGDLFHCDRCDCNWQLHFAMKYVARTGQGLILYHLHHEGRGNGVVAKLRSFVNATGQDPLTGRYLQMPDRRRFGSTLVILEDLGVRHVNLLTNNPHKRRALEERGINVQSNIPIVSSDVTLREYYDFKRQNLGHWIWQKDEQS